MAVTAMARLTIEKTIFGNRRHNHGTYETGNGISTGSIKTDLRKVEYFNMTGLVAFTAVGGVVTPTILDAGGDAVGSWQAIGY